MLDPIITDKSADANKYFTNSIITVYAFKELNKDDEAEEWLGKESANCPDKTLAAWINTSDINALPSTLNKREKNNAAIIKLLLQ